MQHHASWKVDPCDYSQRLLLPRRFKLFNVGLKFWKAWSWANPKHLEENLYRTMKHPYTIGQLEHQNNYQ